MKEICIRKARVHNLKSVSLRLKKNQLIVFTGVSGSGKSSMAFDTLFIEGQRRYVESLSTFTRRYIGDMAKPDVESIDGLSPTISIEQKTTGKNPRSTVGTLTQIYDYMRVLWARVGVPHCPVSGEPVVAQSRERIIQEVQHLNPGLKIQVLAPFARGRKAEFKDDFQGLLRKGYLRVRVDGKWLQLDEEISLDGRLAHDVDVVIDRIKIAPSENSRIAEAVTAALEMGDGTLIVCTDDDERLFSSHAYSPKSGESYQALEPHDFSFNSPFGMCETCNGLGSTLSFDLDAIIDPEKSIAEDCCSVASSFATVRFGNIYRNLSEIYDFDLHAPWKLLPEKAKHVFLHGTEKKWTRMHFIHPEKGNSWADLVRWRGVLHEASERYRNAKSDLYKKRMEVLMSNQLCPSCHGARLKAYPAACRLGSMNIHDVSKMTCEEALSFFQDLSLSEEDAFIAEELLKEICQRLKFLLDVGVNYLSLDRTAPTLSGGEAQRVRLASQIGCGLVGVTYILDEPSIGLHPRDNLKLLKSLQQLRDKGNTVIVVEHDEDTIRAADEIVDFGPGPGRLGGTIVVQGSVSKMLKHPKSVTGAFLSGRSTVYNSQEKRTLQDKTLQIEGACHNNLKNVTLNVPLGGLIGVTGVSGSGKSSLISDVLYQRLVNELQKGERRPGKHKAIRGHEHLSRVIGVDQSPIGRNPRSNPSTYIKLFDEIRELFALLPESKARGYKVGRFSFNVKEGSCSTCLGMGEIKVDLDFMESAWVECTTCSGRRFCNETLSVLFKGKNIYDVLEMEVEDALDFFQAIPQIRSKLQTLKDVGLGYLRLGQASTTLSGGEAQRIKLAKELLKPTRGHCLYILDEPTTGLHFHDIHCLLHVLQRLVDEGNTVLVIEHNMDVIQAADWLIDLGPEGGLAGGEIIAEGRPEDIAKMDTPTGRSLKDHLGGVHMRASKKRTRVETKELVIKGAEENNLKYVNAVIPRGKMTCLTGPSGSGKTSLAMDTIFAEGQRRYVESLSAYARQFVKQSKKPKVQEVDGLSPAIAIEQKVHAGNPRSTVGTMTEVYDFIRILWSRLGTPHCPETGEPIRAISKSHVVERILNYRRGEKLQILAPLQGFNDFEELKKRLSRQGFLRIRLDGRTYELDEDIPFDRKRRHELCLVLDRLKVDPSERGRIAEAVEMAASFGSDKVIVHKGGKDLLFNLSFAVESTGKSYPPITPHSFAFNSASGMCFSCQGLGFQYGAHITQNPEIRQMTLLKLFRSLWGDDASREAFVIMEAVLSQQGLKFSQKVGNLDAADLKVLLHGSDRPIKCKNGLTLEWRGLDTTLSLAGRSAKSQIKEALTPLLDSVTCSQCQGSRINPLARAVLLENTSLAELVMWPISRVLAFFKDLTLPGDEKKILEDVLRQIILRLRFLHDVGLQYLSLNRSAPTLSGGEAQRIRLARQLGSGLTGVLYVLDEPSIGLHPRDNEQLMQALKRLQGLDNTLLMVEHDPLSIQHADYLLDFGPGSGRLGGHITAKGSIKQIAKSSTSLTGQYLSGRRKVPPLPKHPASGYLKVKNASQNNLKDLSLKLPLSQFVCFTGVSGSGKSTLMHSVLKKGIERALGRQKQITIDGCTISGIEQIQRLLVVDQNPIGHTKRANVGTYVDLLPEIRKVFAQLPEARAKGLDGRYFSFNHRKGMCNHCWGMGYKRVEMHFLPAVRVPCSQCKGMRLTPASLEVTFHGKNFGEILQLTCDEAARLFANLPKPTRILKTLQDVGLGYLQLGQEMASLSGGEAQRLKLSRDLVKTVRGHCLYMLDEPTVGLHPQDVEKLLIVIQGLLSRGHSVFVIEHNLDLIQNADFIVDLGPEAGSAGGEVIAMGSVEEIATCPASHTGKYLCS